MDFLGDLRFLGGLGLGLALSVLAVVLRQQLEVALSALASRIPLAVLRTIRDHQWERKYRSVLYEEHRHLRYVGVKFSPTISRPKLEDVYVSLQVHGFETPRHDSAGTGLALAQVLSFEAAFERFRQMVILGGPGAGKTTLFEHLVCVCCKPRDRRSKEAMAKLLPVFVPLRRCSLGVRSLVDELVDPATRILPPDLLRTYPTGFFERYLDRGKCLLMFDGLDEVASDDAHVAAARMVDTTAAIFGRCRVLVSSRVAGWRNLLSSQFERFLIRDLSPDDIEGLVRQWYSAVVVEQVRSKYVGQPSSEWQSAATSIAAGQAEQFIQVLRKTPRLSQIATSPLILSLMCLVFFTRQDLPRQRVRLYEECVDILLNEWDRKDKQLSFGHVAPSYRRELLEVIALYLFDNAASELSRQDLERVIDTYRTKNAIRADREEIVRVLEERSGLIAEKAIGLYSFTHLTFQEFFVAVGLNRREDGLDRLMSTVTPADGEETIGLFAGLAERADSLVERLLDVATSTHNVSYLIAAARAAADARDLSLQWRSRLLALLNTAFDTAVDPALTRIQGALADLGVNRIVVRRFEEFVIQAEIGRGGMATVYNAFDSKRQRQVALKVYVGTHTSTLERVQAHFDSLRALSHVALVDLYELGVSNGQVFAAMELLQGTTLSKVIDKMKNGDQFLDIPKFGSREYRRWVASVMTDVCGAVSYLHRHRLVHHDLKPSNLMYVGNSHCKVMDVGVDHLLVDFSRTISGPLHTLDYASPEVLTGNAGGGAADIYSLGVIFGELVTLNKPNFLERTKWSWSDQLGRVPEDDAVARVVARATDLSPAKRYQTADAFLEEISGLFAFVDEP